MHSKCGITDTDTRTKYCNVEDNNVCVCRLFLILYFLVGPVCSDLTVIATLNN